MLGLPAVLQRQHLLLIYGALSLLSVLPAAVSASLVAYLASFFGQQSRWWLEHVISEVHEPTWSRITDNIFICSALSSSSFENAK